MRRVYWLGLAILGWMLIACVSAENTTQEATTDDDDAILSASVTTIPIDCPNDTRGPGSISKTFNGYANVLYTEENLDALLSSDRPKFLVAYAPWWGSWRSNQPVVNELSTKYFCDVDFFFFNTEEDVTQTALDATDIRQRSTYVLQTADGSEHFPLVWTH